MTWRSRQVCVTNTGMRNHYLQTMGIEVWRLRSHQVLPAYYSFTLTHAGYQPVGLLLADAVEHSEEERQLAMAMAKATRLQVSEVDVPDLDNLDERIQVLLLLGKAMSHRFLDGDLEKLHGTVHRLNHRSVIVSYSLSQLLADPALKAAAWKDLQCAMKAMGK